LFQPICTKLLGCRILKLKEEIGHRSAEPAVEKAGEGLLFLRSTKEASEKGPQTWNAPNDNNLDRHSVFTH
jgi:hypothetical protein